MSGNGPPGSTDDHGLLPAHQVISEGLRRASGHEAIVIVQDVSEAEVRFADNTTTTNGVRRDRVVTAVAVIRRGGTAAAGVASASGDVDIGALMDRAATDARSAPPAEDAAPLVGPGPDHADDADHADHAEWEEPAPETGLGALGRVLGALSGAFARAQAHDQVLAGFAEHRLETTALATTTGARLRHVQPTGALHLAARSDGGRRSAWCGVGTPDFADVSVEAMEEALGRRLEWARRQVARDPGHYEVILPPAAVADLMTALIDAAGLRDAQEGHSVFSGPGGTTRLGRPLTPRPVRLWSDPAAPGIQCAPFAIATASGADHSVFDNGVPLHATDWIRDGRLTRLRSHRAGAAGSGLAPSPGIDNLGLEVAGATGSLDDLVARTDHGLLLTCLWYIREVDPTTLLLTGLTRDGVYVVEDGEIVGATNNFRFNESPVALLERITDATAATRTLGREFGEWANRTIMPALRVRDFHMSSVSDST